MNEIKIIKFLLEWILNNIFLFTLENLNLQVDCNNIDINI